MKRHAPATSRNSAPIADVLARELPPEGLVLEIASGTGEHAIFLANRFPNLQWQPSDDEAGALASITAWTAESGVGNLLPPVKLDASTRSWPVAAADVILCVNMIHISPWAASEGLFAGAAKLLERGAPLILYGPFLEADVATAPSNLAFDDSLQGRNPEWGIRQLRAVDALAAGNNLTRTARYAMPANNLIVVYRRDN